jgi:hypothetical protein
MHSPNDSKGAALLQPFLAPPVRLAIHSLRH